MPVSLLDKRVVDGIFYLSDTLAYGGLEAMCETAKYIPCIGYDGQLPSRYLGISSIRQPGHELGYEGALALVRHIPRSTPLTSRSFPPEQQERSIKT